MNADDPTSCRVLASADVPVITVGIQKPAELTATLLERQRSEQTFLLEAGAETFAVRTRIVGDDHIYSCLLATAAALAAGISPEGIIRGLEAVEQVPGRLQRIECGQPFGFFIDDAHTAESVANVLSALREVTDRRLHCVLGVDHHLSAAERAKMGRVLEQLSDNTVLTATTLDRRMSLKTAHEVLDGFDRPSQAHLLPDRTKAVGWTLSQARAGDVLLLAGGRPSSEPTQIMLTDEDVAHYWLQHSDLPGLNCWQPA